MATYMIFIREGEVVDQAAMDAYRAGNRSGRTAGTEMKPLVAYGSMETYEGAAPDGIAVLEFPDAEAAKGWYFSEDYQARAKLRQQAAPYRCVMVEGI